MRVTFIKRFAGFGIGIAILGLMGYWQTKPDQSEFVPNKLPHRIPLSAFPSSADNDKLLGNNSATKRILLWTRLDHFYFDLENDPLKRHKCTVDDCFITTDRGFLQSSDAIVFNFRDVNVSDLPAWRSPEQRWIFYMVEPPEYTKIELLRLFNGKFNWTMTYRFDSDIVKTYGWSSPKKRSPKKKSNASPQQPLSNNSHVGERRHLAVWMVSHCNTKGKREKYVEELQRHIPIEVYGKCAKNETRRTCPEESCGAALYQSHKFYLAFENSVCRDYVTEKFFKALRNHVVPIVYGGADYERVAPPGSYVDVRDFDSPRHLAEHLKTIDANDTLYGEYLKWSDDWNIWWNFEIQHGFCYLCAALHNPRAETNSINKVYDDIATWWSGRGICGKINDGNDSITMIK